jgi:hypothetical protein
MLLFFLIAVFIGVFVWTPGMAFLVLLKIIGIIFGITLVIVGFAVMVAIAIRLISGEI